jgi:hypothetical protein
LETPNIRLAVIGCFVVILFLCMFIMLFSYKVGSGYEGEDCRNNKQWKLCFGQYCSIHISLKCLLISGTACFILLFYKGQYHSIIPAVFPEHIQVYSVHSQWNSVLRVLFEGCNAYWWIIVRKVQCDLVLFFLFSCFSFFWVI